MNDRIAGFILKQTDYREHAVLLTVLTEEYGKISLIAAGARKMASKNAGSILPYTEAEFLLDYRDDRTIFRMKTASTIHFYRQMHETLAASLAAAVLAEAADALTYEDSDPLFSRAAFQLLDEGFSLLDQGRRTDVVTAIFLARLLAEAGIGPNVDECAVCGSTKVAAISVKDGGFLCESCARRAEIPLGHPAQLHQFRLLNKALLSQAEVAEQHVSNALEDAETLTRILQEHAGVQLRSFSLYKRLFAIE